MITHKLNDKTTLQFRPIYGEDFIPYLVQGDIEKKIPLLVTEAEISVIQEKIKHINFLDLSLDYIKMVIAGCMSILMKQQHT